MLDAMPWLIAGDELRAWTPGGYTLSRSVRPGERLTVLTPAAAVATIAAGYSPAVA